MDETPTLLYAIDPENDNLYVIAADAVEALTLEARKIAWLMESTWEEISTGLSSLPDEFRACVEGEVEDRLDNVWIDQDQDDDLTERPMDWFPPDDNRMPFDDDWLELQGSPVNRSWVGLPEEILTLGRDVGRPGASYEGIFFDVGDLDSIRTVAESLGLDLIRDDMTVMRCWPGVWRDEGRPLIETPRPRSDKCWEATSGLAGLRHTTKCCRSPLRGRPAAKSARRGPGSVSAECSERLLLGHRSSADEYASNDPPSKQMKRIRSTCVSVERTVATATRAASCGGYP